MRSRMLFVLASTGTLLTPTEANAETVKLIVHVRCAPSVERENTTEATETDGPICAGNSDGIRGFSNISELREHIDATVADANLSWSTTGVSFQPELDYAEDARLAAFTGISFNNRQHDQSKEYADLVALTSDDPGDLTAAHWIVAEQHVGDSWSWGDLPAVFTSLRPGGKNLAHELGHYFGLWHTHTGSDGPGANHDNDHALLARQGGDCTPPDFRFAEYPDDDFATAADAIDYRNLRPDHAYCTLGELSLYINSKGEERVRYQTGTMVGADFGSPRHLAPYSPRCYSSINHTPARDFVNVADFANAMSYYWDAQGPWVQNGIRRNAFCETQVSVIRQTLAERGLVDVCKDSGDRDNDGICDEADACPDGRAEGLSPALQVDADNDGIVAECDICDKPGEYGAVDDIDGDGVVGPCDSDEDNDGCPDSSDKDPLNGIIFERTLIRGPTCRQPGSAAYYAPAGVNPDGDSYRSCDVRELDSDNDGLDDAVDPCPLVPGTNCTEYVDCGFLNVPLTICGQFCGGWSFELDAFGYPPLKLAAVSDIDGLLVMKGNKTQTATEVVRELATRLEARSTVFVDSHSLVERSPEYVIFRVWSPEGESKGSWDLRGVDFTIAPGDGGPFIYLQLPAEGKTTGAISVGSSPVPHRTQGKEFADADGDGVPDAMDNCVCVHNAAQRDRNLNRVGDACDPDVDGNGARDLLDLELLQDCIGSFLLSDNASEADLDASEHCAGADFDGDGVVTSQDEAILTELMVQPDLTATPTGSYASWEGACTIVR